MAHTRKYDYKNAGAPAQKEGESLEKYYKRLAKQADQRMVRLEAYAHDEHYAGILKYAYANALDDIARFGGDKRFNTAVDPKQMQAKINAIKRFLDAPTSTKKGVTEIYQKRADTVNKKYGTKFTWRELATYFENAEAGKFDKEFKYNTDTFKAIGIIQKVGDDPKDIQAAIESNKKLDEDEVVNEIAKNLMEKGITYNDLFT